MPIFALLSLLNSQQSHCANYINNPVKTECIVVLVQCSTLSNIWNYFKNIIEVLYWSAYRPFYCHSESRTHFPNLVITATLTSIYFVTYFMAKLELKKRVSRPGNCQSVSLSQKPTASTNLPEN